MEVIGIRMKDGTSGVLSQTYIDTSNPGFSQYKLTLDGNFVIVEHDKKGCYAVPLTSVAWMRINKKVKKVGRPKKSANQPVKVAV